MSSSQNDDEEQDEPSSGNLKGHCIVWVEGAGGKERSGTFITASYEFRWLIRLLPRLISLCLVC